MTARRNLLEMETAIFHWQQHHSGKAYLPRWCFCIRKWASSWYLWMNSGNSIFAVNGGALAPRLRLVLDISYLLSSTYRCLRRLFLQIQLLDCIAAFFCDSRAWMLLSQSLLVAAWQTQCNCCNSVTVTAAIIVVHYPRVTNRISTLLKPSQYGLLKAPPT